MVADIKLRQIRSELTHSRTVTWIVIKEGQELFVNVDFLILSFSDNLLL